MLDGFDFLYKRTSEVLLSSTELSKFFTKLHQIEQKYAKDLNKIAKTYRANKIIEKELGTFRDCWNLALNELENKGNKHNDFSNRILNEIAIPITQHVKDKETARKKLVMQGQKLTKEYQESLAALQKAKGTYVGRCKEADTATGQYQKAKAEGSIKPKELNKLNSKSAKATDCAMTANTEYRKFLKKANEKQSKFYEKEMPKLLSEFQEFEEERIRFMKSNCVKYAKMENEFPAFYKRSAESLVETSENIDVAKDIDVFLQNFSTKASVPPEIPYEPYTPTNPNQDFGGPAGSSSAPSSVASAAAPRPGARPETTSGDYGLSGADASLSADAKKEKLQKQLEDLRTQIKEQVKSKKGLQKLVKFYASDPVAQDRANKELEEQKAKIQGLKDQAAELERELAALDGDAPSTPRVDGSGDDYHESPAPYYDHDPANTGYESKDPIPDDPVPDEDPAEFPEESVTAVALYDYEATNETELSFKEGDILTITERDGSGWWYAEIDGRVGFTPANYLQVQE